MTTRRDYVDLAAALNSVLRTSTPDMIDVRAETIALAAQAVGRDLASKNPRFSVALFMNNVFAGFEDHRPGSRSRP